MKKLTYYSVALALLIACNANEKEENVKNVEASTQKQEVNEPMPSGDYGTLFTDYKCDITVSEIGKALDVPEADLKRADIGSPENCAFYLQGFGSGYDKQGTYLNLMSTTSTKAQNKKVIASHLEEKEERPNGMLMGRDILMAETGDCYITFQPLHGRVLLLNENYDGLFMISYENRNTQPDRTKEQHQELTQKIKALANYLLTKHRK